MQLALFLSILLSILLSASSQTIDGYLGGTDDDGVYGFTWDVEFGPAVSDQQLPVFHHSLEQFIDFMTKGFLADLVPVLGLTGLTREDTGSFLRCELIDRNILRASTLYNSQKDSASYKSYVAFSKTATVEALNSMLTTITPMSVTVGGQTTSFPWVRLLKVYTIAFPWSCADQVKNENESDVDVGGTSICPRAWPGKACTKDDDCVEFSLCQNVDELGVGKCSTMTPDAAQRNYEESRNSAIISSSLTVLLAALVAIIF